MVDELNPFANGSSIPQTGAARNPVPFAMMLGGLIVGAIGLALVSNRFGNTDTYGLPVLGVGGMIFCIGVCNRFMKLRYAVVVGIAALPACPVLLFVLYWVGIFLTAAANS